MPESKTTGTLRIRTERAGTVAELSEFLANLEAAYVALYWLDSTWSHPRPRRPTRMMFEFFLETGFPYPVFPWPGAGVITPESLLPEHRLLVTRVSIESPGFWEFVGSLNPLQQIREYLNDRHKRRQDKEFREAAERDRLILENELVQRQIWEKDNSLLRDRIDIMKELGFTNEEIRQVVWATVGKPLAQLGKHQDSRLIEDAE